MGRMLASKMKRVLLGVLLFGALTTTPAMADPAKDAARARFIEGIDLYPDLMPPPAPPLAGRPPPNRVLAPQGGRSARSGGGSTECAPST